MLHWVLTRNRFCVSYSSMLPSITCSYPPTPFFPLFKYYLTVWLCQLSSWLYQLLILYIVTFFSTVQKPVWYYSELHGSCCCCKTLHFAKQGFLKPVEPTCENRRKSTYKYSPLVKLMYLMLCILLCSLFPFSLPASFILPFWFLS